MQVKHIVVICMLLIPSVVIGAGVVVGEPDPKIMEADDVQALAHWIYKKGKDVNTLKYRSKPLLLGAAEEGSVNIVEFLIMSGADVEVVDDFLNSNIWNHAADADRNSEQLVRLLKQQNVPGIDNLKGFGGMVRTPLMDAVIKNPAVVPLLVEYGADPTIDSGVDGTALDYAYFYQRDKTIISLLSEAMQRKTEEKKQCR